MEKGDVIQITDETHPWYPCLMLVTDVKSWGVQAGALIPQSNDGSAKPSTAYNRLRTGTFERIGRAVVVESDEETPCT